MPQVKLELEEIPSFFCPFNGHTELPKRRKVPIPSGSITNASKNYYPYGFSFRELFHSAAPIGECCAHGSLKGRTIHLHHPRIFFKGVPGNETLTKEVRTTSIASSMVFEFSSYNQIIYQPIETPGSVGTKGEGVEMSGNFVGPLTGKSITLRGYRAIERKTDPFCCFWRDDVGLSPGHDPGDICALAASFEPSPAPSTHRAYITDPALCTISFASSSSLKEHSERWPYHAPEYRPPQTCTIRSSSSIHMFYLDMI